MTVRKKTIILILITVMILPLSAAENRRDGVTMIDDGTRTEWFITCYDALAQNLGMGGYIIFTPEGEFLSMWLSEGTPKDFFSRLPASTLSIPEILPVPACAALCEAVGDKPSVAVLSEYVLENPAVVMVISFKTYEPIVVDEPYRALKLQEIEKSVGQLGMNTDEFYELFGSVGMDADALTERVLAGENPRDIALEGLAMKQNMRKTEGNVIINVLSAALLILGTGVAIAVIPILVGSNKGENKDE